MNVFPYSHVFCYKCIVQHLRRRGEGEIQGRCPVTGVPAREQDLVRIFDQRG